MTSTFPGTHRCLTDEQVVSLAAGLIPSAAAQQLLADIESCAVCRELLVEAGVALQSGTAQGDLGGVFHPGDTIGQRYKVIRLVGRGGMGEVFEVYDGELQERVALKTLRLEYSDDQHLVQRFKQELRLARKVVHPNVGRVYDLGAMSVGLSQELYYYTMEFIQGESMAKWTQQRPLPIPMALRIARQLANGLAAIHEHGIVHRDLKLENILVKESAAQEPKCMIVDFGVARSKERLPGLQTTGRGVRFGTLDYMAPEVLNAHPASFASDVYAFGLLIGELMIGRHPCPNSGTRAALGALGEQAVPPLTRLRPEVPPALGEIVDCCVKVQPDLRPTNGHALVLALSRLDELGWPLASSRASNDLGKTRHGVS